MSDRIVTTQAELDTAIANGVEDIEIRSPRGVWIEVSGSASVSASGSASVSAFGSASVSASGSASVRASGSASVSASGSASVRASGSASVSASGSASVSASGSASVSAFDSASVSASTHVAVHLHSGHARITGGVVINHMEVNETDPAVWCDYHGVEVVDGVATVYKAVDDEWTTSRARDINLTYAPGSLPECPDWLDNNECGNGLHFSPTPTQALWYQDGATRFVAVGVAVADMRPIVNQGGPAKCKAPRVVSACVAVDEHARVLSVGLGELSGIGGAQ